MCTFTLMTRGGALIAADPDIGKPVCRALRILFHEQFASFPPTSNRP